MMVIVQKLRYSKSNLLNQLPVTKNELVWGLIGLISLFIISLHNYLLFHSFVEMFSIFVACGIFVVIWQDRHSDNNKFFLLIGIGYLFIGGFDFLHTLAYKGMGIFPETNVSANLATQLWIVTRYLESITLLIGIFIIGLSTHSKIREKITPSMILGGYIFISSLILLSIFTWKLFPVCYIDGEGLSNFKIISEYVIIGILVIVAVNYYLKRDYFDESVLFLLLVAVIFTIVAEFCFTLYLNVYGLPNLIGHYSKIISFYAIFKGIVQANYLDKLKESEERYRLVVQNANDAIITTNSQKKIIVYNKHTYQMFNYSENELINKPLSDIVPDLSIHETALIQVLSTGESSGIEILETIGLRKDHTEFPIELSLANWETTKGTFYTGIIRDISERKQAEFKLQKQKKELSEFAHMIAHDSRSSLLSIQGYANILAKSGENEFTEKIKNLSKKIMDLHERSVELADAGLVIQKNEEGNLTKLVNQIAQEVIPETILFSCGKLPSVKCDKQKITQVFNNLFDNAITHGKPSKIDVISENSNVLIRNDGKPISSENLTKIFNQGFTTKKEKGGLGLVIVKKIVEAHGWTIEVESTSEATIFIISMA
ncbi:MAG: MASE3 domain-containing protein [Candidatus Hodarchaeales archaeon]|jgi:PAS domain S-box-containing protein